jgi:hypothetical protein
MKKNKIEACFFSKAWSECFKRTLSNAEYKGFNINEIVERDLPDGDSSVSVEKPVVFNDREPYNERDYRHECRYPIPTGADAIAKPQNEEQGDRLRLPGKEYRDRRTGNDVRIDEEWNQGDL